MHLNSNSLDLEKLFLLSITFETRRHFCKVQGRVFIKPADFTSFRLLSIFFRDSNKFASTQALFSRSFNILAVAFVSLKAFLRVYTNKDVQNIIWAIIEAKPVAAKSFCKYLLKACFFNVYKSDNHIACYNFYQQCKVYFAIARIKGSNYIFFTVLFFLRLYQILLAII